jgi:hypothetical protein
MDINEPGALTESLSAIWSRAIAESGRRDVLIMEFILGQREGTAKSLAESAVDEHLFWEEGQPIHPLPKLGPWQRPSTDAPPYIQRLQQLLRGVRRTFGRADWRVEWVDDGRICWLLALAKITP